jgi:tight adherence protein B
VSVRDQIVLAILICLTIVVFLAARRLLDRRRLILERRLGPKEAAAPPPPPNLASRLDAGFTSLVDRASVGMTANQMLGFLALAAIGMAALLFFLRGQAWAAPLGLVLGLGLPLAVLFVLRRRRQRLIQSQLPDAFYFQARSLRAGASFEQTLTRSGEQLAEPLAAEFRRCSGLIQLGVAPYDALRQSARTIDLTDFDNYVSTVGLYYHSGGNLALLLDRLAAATRDRVQFRGYFQAATALARLGAFVLAAAVPILFLYYFLVQPSFIGSFFETAAGWQLVGVVALLELFGLLLCWYFLRVDY